MFNLVVLTGRLTADPELKYTPTSVPVTSFSIAVNRRYKQGEEQQADFINIVAWRQTAEFITKYFNKGSLIGIEGSIQTRRYQDSNDNNRTVFEVIANNVQFVESKRDNNAENSAYSGNTEDFTDVSDEDGDLPF